MPTQDLSGTTALVTGASRGFGRGIATALSEAGAVVVGVARDHARLEDLRTRLGDTFTPVVADAADPTTAGQLIDTYHPRTLVLNAGANPLTRPIHHQTWQTFSRNWEVDVQQVFHWTREALLRPLAPGSVVIALSSGAALGGSPLSGGYAGAKATIRFLTSYAAAESERDALGIRFTSVLPKLTPATDLGASGVAAYADRQGVDIATSWRASARRSFQSTLARPSSISPSTPATTRTPTCSRPPVSPQSNDPATKIIPVVRAWPGWTGSLGRPGHGPDVPACRDLQHAWQVFHADSAHTLHQGPASSGRHSVCDVQRLMSSFLQRSLS